MFVRMRRRYVRVVRRRSRRTGRFGTRRRPMAKYNRRGVKKTSRGRRLMDGGASGSGQVPYLPLSQYVFSPNTASQARAAKRMRSSVGLGANDPDNGTGAYNQWSQRYAQAKFGSLTLKKLLKNMTDVTTFTWQKYARFGDNGQIFMNNHEDTVNGNWSLPCNVFDLTSVANWSNGALNAYSPLWSLRKKTAAGTNGRYDWITVAGQDPTGTSSNTWQVEKSSHKVTTQMAYPNEQSVLKWASIELELWGMKNHPTKWTVEVCQFSEDVCPSQGVSADGNYNEFWDSMLKQYQYNPLANNLSGFGKKVFKVLRRYNVDIDPTASFENDADPHVKTMKIFLRFNRRCNYEWKHSNAAGQTGAEFGSVNWQQEDNENQSTVHPNARVFLMLRASNYNYLTDNTQISSANTPSYSIKVKTQHILSN